MDPRNKLFSRSEVKDFERGKRRYYPLSDDKDKHHDEAMEILFGKSIKDIPPVTFFVCDPMKYIEEFDGKYWVRTVDRVEKKKYVALFSLETTGCLEVEAYDKNDARERARDEYEPHLEEEFYFETTGIDIEEVTA